MQKISVIIPTYNSASYLPEAIESVLAQTYENYEIIVIDDGSTDNTKEVVVPYLDQIVFLQIENGGPAKARNHGIRYSIGDYVAFLDADDIWYPIKLDRQMTLFKKNPQYGLMYSDVSYARTYSSQKGRTFHSYCKHVKEGRIFSELLHECFIALSSVIVKRDCLERVGLFDENCELWQGYDLWLRIAFENQIGLVNEPLYYRRIHEENRFYSDSLKNILSIIMIMEKWDKDALRLSEADRKIVNQRLCAKYRSLGKYYLTVGCHDKARSALKKSIARGSFAKGVVLFGLSIIPYFVVQFTIATKRRFNSPIQKL